MFEKASLASSVSTCSLLIASFEFAVAARRDLRRQPATGGDLERVARHVAAVVRDHQALLGQRVGAVLPRGRYHVAKVGVLLLPAPDGDAVRHVWRLADGEQWPARGDAFADGLPQLRAVDAGPPRFAWRGMRSSRAAHGREHIALPTGSDKDAGDGGNRQRSKHPTLRMSVIAIDRARGWALWVRTFRSFCSGRVRHFPTPIFLLAVVLG